MGLKIDNNFIDKFFIVSCLALAIYVTIACPCKLILSCHLIIFSTLILLPLIYVFIKQIIPKK